jgi:hypothetical protein
MMRVQIFIHLVETKRIFVLLVSMAMLMIIEIACAFYSETSIFGQKPTN